MRANKILILIFILVFIFYIVAQLNAPKDFDWTPTLSGTDKNPFGSELIYKELKSIFPGASIQLHREAIYNVLHKKESSNSAYILLEPEFDPGKTDMDELLDYVREGNIVFLSAQRFSQKLLDTLGLKPALPDEFAFTETIGVNFVNPELRMRQFYSFNNQDIEAHFKNIKKQDSTVVLGITKDSMPDFVKVQYGEGYFLVHAAPICFTNYFLLYHNNSDYLAKALSYIPADISTIHWDEYYKSGPEGASTPLRFFLSDTYLRWALWLAVIGLVLYVLFGMKRRQRIIPVIEPLRNTTLDFVETVSSVYFSTHDNNSIAKKKIQFWLDHIRQRYYLSTQYLDDNFVQQLQRKSAVPKELLEIILRNIQRAEAQPKVTDETLSSLTKSIDEFYQLSKI